MSTMQTMAQGWTSRRGAISPAVLGTLFAVGLIGTLAVTASASPAVVPSSGGGSADPAPLVTGPPAPLTLPATPVFGGAAGFSVAASWPTVVIGMPAVDTLTDTAAGAVLVENVVTGSTTTIQAPNPEPYGEFGYSVALSSNYLVVGAPEVIEGGSSAVDVYNASTLQLVASLSDPVAPWQETFGFSVATSGSTVVVGAVDANASGVAYSGRAYLYSPPSWAPTVLSSPNPTAGGFFGWSVSISGSTVLVGAPGESPGGLSDAGRAYEFDAVTGDLVRSFTSPWPEQGPNVIGFYTGFGVSVSVVGTTGLIGDPSSEGPNYTGPAFSGAAFEYNLVSGAMTTLTSPRAQVQGFFGKSVALGTGGVWLAVGAPNETGGGVAGSGTAYLFNDNLGSAEQSEFSSPLAVAHGLFGFSVAVSSSQVVVGAPGEGQDSSGHAYVFRTPAYTLTGGANPPGGESFGASVATAGTFVVVGATGTSEGEGSAFVFNTRTSTELQLTSPDPQEESEFGASVAVSGNLVAVGQPFYSSLSDSDVGMVWVFNATTGALVQSVPAPAGHAYTDGLFGYSVGISGATLVVGAPGANGFLGMAFVCGALNGSCGTVFQPETSGLGFVGFSVAINGSTAIVGAPLANSTGGTPVEGAGVAWVLHLGPTLTTTVLNSGDPQFDGHFGLAVGIDQGSAIVGAIGETSGGVAGDGSAYIFNSTTGALARSLTSPNPQDGGDFGSSVGIAGVTAVVGADSEEAYVPGSGYMDYAGNAYLFSTQTGAATLAFPASDGVTDGELGTSVAISDRTVVFGASGDAPALGDYTGCAYIL